MLTEREAYEFAASVSCQEGSAMYLFVKTGEITTTLFNLAVSEYHYGRVAGLADLPLTVFVIVTDVRGPMDNWPPLAAETKEVDMKTKTIAGPYWTRKKAQRVERELTAAINATPVGAEIIDTFDDIVIPRWARGVRVDKLGRFSWSVVATSGRGH